MNKMDFKKMILLSFGIMASMSIYAQASGGQIRRQPQQVSKSSRQQGVAKTPKVYNPVDMEAGIYYMCINETWVVKNGQDLCRKMAAKGYDAELVKNPDPSMGYHVSVYKTKDKNSAINFYNNFNDDRWEIAYPFYDREYLPDFLSVVSGEPVVTDSRADQETIAMIPITEAVSDGKNVSEWAKSNNLTTILYMVNKELYMANIAKNGESQSYGPLTIIDSKTEEKTATSYKIDKWTCHWSFENSYDSVKGSCQVFITMIDKPTQISCHIKMIVDDGKDIEYYGDVEK